MVAINSILIEKDEEELELENKKKKWKTTCVVVLLILINMMIISLLVFRSCNLKHTRLQSNQGPNLSQKVVCYYNFPSANDLSLKPHQIDPFICTHIVASFLTITEGTLDATTNQIIVLKDLLRLKTRNPNLKIMISVGGGGTDGGFSPMVINHAKRKTFIKSVRIFINSIDLDGVDLDWEYPNRFGTNETEKIHFIQLLEEFRIVIDRHSNPKFLLSVAVPASIQMTENCCYIPHINENVDFINLMTYDYHFYSTVTPFTGHNSPLFQSPMDKGLFYSFNMNFSLFNWESGGMERGKINVGLPTYGHTYKLLNRANNGTYAPASGYGQLGGNGFASYDQICEFLKQKDVTTIFENATESPFAYRDFEWLSYDNEKSLLLKAQFVHQQSYSGVMIYSLNADDFLGKCDSRKFPLIRSIISAFDKN